MAKATMEIFENEQQKKFDIKKKFQNISKIVKLQGYIM